MAARAEPTPNGAYAARVDAALGFGLLYVLLAVAAVIVTFPRMFTGRFARRHRLFGLGLLLWLVLGFADALLWSGALVPDLIYDCALGVLGTATTISAANDFRRAHARVTNDGSSGTLAESATVTPSEMDEHSCDSEISQTRTRPVPEAGPSRSPPPRGADSPGWATRPTDVSVALTYRR